MGKNNKQKQHVQNSNGQNAQKQKAKKPQKIQTKKSRGWSCCSILNMVLFTALIATLLASLYVCADGDISSKGLQKALPIMNKNFQKMVNVTVEKVKSGKFGDLMSSAVSGTSTAWKAFSKQASPLVSSLYKYLLIGWDSLQTVTGDLSPYTDALVFRAKQLYVMVSKATMFILESLFDYISKLNVAKLRSDLTALWNFVVEQVYVLQEELAKNKALTSFWKDMQPYRDSVWSGTEVARKQFWSVCATAQNEWFPLIQNQTVTYFNIAKNSVMKLF